MPPNLIYNALDVTTDSYVTLERNPTPWTSWDVTISPLTGILPRTSRQFDSLIDAAAYVAGLVGQFEDDDRPSAEDVISGIAGHFNDEKIYVGWDEDDVFLVNEHEWDEED